MNTASQTARYEIREPLGRGGQATVHLGLDRATGELVALRADRGAGASFRLRAGLRQPSIVSVRDHAAQDGTVWLVEEFVDGTPWSDAAPRAPRELLGCARHLLHAVRYLHEHEVVHRDIKPENLVLQAGRDGPIPVLIDFGLASARAATASRSGTLGTVAPEVLAGTADLRLADLFGLGTTLLARALGEAPDPRWSLEPEPLRHALDGAPSELRALLVGLCSPRARDRFRSAAEAIDALPRDLPTLWTPAEAWPFVGRLDPAAEAWAEGRGPRVLCVHGPAGAGKRTLATRARRIAESKGAPIASFPELRRTGDPEFARLVALARRPSGRIVCTTDSEEVRRTLRAVVPDDVVLVQPRALDPEAIGELCRWLPAGSRVDPAELAERSGGDPRTIVEILLGRDDDDAGRESSDAELYLAVRGQPVDRRELADGQQPDQVAVEAAASAGFLRVERDGRFSLAGTERAARLLQAAGHDRLRALHALAAERTTGEEARYHRAAGGSRDALSPCLHWLAARVATDSSEAERRLAHLRELVGADLRQEPRALYELGRALVVASRTAVVTELLADIAIDGPPFLVALSAYARSERGQPEVAIAWLRSAIEREPELPLAAWLDLARAEQLTAQFERALATLARARPLAAGDVDTARIELIRSIALYRLGRVDQAVDAAETALARLPADEEQRLRLAALQNLGMMLRHKGELERAARILERAGEQLLALGDLRTAAIAWINAGIAWQDAGRLARSQALREQAAKRCEIAGLAQPRDVALAGLGITLGQRGAWPASVALLTGAEAELRAQGLEREALMARVFALEAKAAIEPDGTEAALASCLDQAQAAGFWAEAAVAWRALLTTGASPEVPTCRARRLLEKADRGTREALRIELHARRANHTGSTRSLERLAAHGLPRTRVFACEALLGRSRAPEARRVWLARALRAARRVDAPADAIRLALTALATSRDPALHARRIRARATELEKMLPIEESDPLVKTWTRQLATLRDTADRILEAGTRGDGQRIEPFLAVNRLLLDENTDEEARFRHILEQAMRLTSAYRGMLVTRTARGTERITVSLTRRGAATFEQESFDFSQSLLDDVIETGQPKVTVNALEDPEWRHAHSVVDFNLVSIACVPLRAGSDVLGALYLDNPFEQGRFAADAVETLNAFGTQISLGLSAARQRDAIGRLNRELAARLEDRTQELASARRELAGIREKRSILYQSEKMGQVMKKVRRLAATDLPVHLRGETGTGKELVARKLHELSERRDAAFVAENCSAIAGEILESELFGHVAGAFTGATRDKPGLLRSASGGTLFLDEIGDMPLRLQTRLLRVLQEGEVRPVGGDAVVPVDVRLITATHRDLAEMVEEGSFREDLYYRIVVAAVALPPLRERPSDIPLLAAHFLRAHGRPGMAFDPSALDALARYDWPGNVRELESAVRNAVVMTDGPLVRAECLPIGLTARTPSPGGSGVPTTNLKELERLAIRQALEEVAGNRAQAARRLGISRSSVFAKIREYGLS